MTDLATIGFRAETSGLVRARNDLDKLADQGERTEKRVSGAMGGIGKAFAAIASAAGVGSLASKLIETERQTGILSSSLKVATGSAQNASEAFGAIQRLATQLPESVDTVSQAFIKLTNMGLDPSEAAIKSYSNTAAAMGKDLNQMIEAVADAATGEFERLKEFGIKAKQQGDQVSFTFRGVTTTVAKEADAITGYLRQIGDVTFAGAATERMKTLDGAISNLGDTWDGLFRTINSAGVGDFIADSVRSATGTIQELNDLIASGQLAAYLDAIAAKFVGWSGDVSRALAIVETEYQAIIANFSGGEGIGQAIVDSVKNMPENVRFFIQAMVIEIAAGFDRVKANSTAFVDTIKAIFTDDTIANVGARLQEEMARIDSVRRDSLQLAADERQAAISASEAQIKAAEDLREKYDEQQESILSAGDALGKYGIKAGEAADSVEKITTQTKRLASVADQMAVDELFGQFGDAGENPFENMQSDIDASKQELDDLITSVDEFGGAWSRTGDTIAEALGSMSDGVENYAARLEAISQKEAELAAARAKTFDPADLAKISKAEKKLSDERVKANVSGYRQITNAAASMFKEGSKGRKALTAVDQAMTAIELALSLKRGLALATEAVLNQGKGDPYSAFARMAAMAAVVGAIGFAVAGAGGGGGGGPSAEEIQAGQGTGSLLGSEDKSESILNAMESYKDIGVDQLSELRGIRDAMSDLSSGISQLAISLVSGGRFSGAGVEGLGTVANKGIVGDLAGQLLGGSFADPVTAAILGSTKKSLKDTGLLIGAQDLGDILGGDLSAFYYNTIETTKKKLFGLSKSVKTKDQLSGADADLIDQFTSIFGFIGAAVSESVGVLGIDAVGAIEDFKVNIGKISFKDLSGEEIEQELNAVFSQQADLIAGFVAPQIREYQLMGEGLFETLARVAKEQAVFNDALDGIGLSLGDLSAIMRVDVAQAVIQLMGGLEEFTDKTQEYFDAFFSEQEKMDILAGSLSDIFGSLNLSIPQSRDEFRALVEGLDLTTAAGQEMFAVLMEVVPGLDQYISGLEKAADAQLTAANKLAEAEAAAAKAAEQAQARIDAQRNNLEIRLLQEQGKIDEALARQRELELAGLDESLQGLQKEIYAQQDANKAMEAAKKLAEEQAKAAEEAARAQIEAAEDAARAQMQAQEEAIRAAEQAAEEQQRLISGTQDAITAAIRALRGESEQLNDIDRQRAKNTLSAALAAAEAGQSIIGFAGLDEALTAVQKIDKSQFASAEAYQREVGRTLSVLDRLGGYAGIAPKTPVPTTSPVIPMGTVTQAQTAQQLAVNVQNIEAQMLDLTKKIEDNTKKSKDLLDRWERIGMPATRA